MTDRPAIAQLRTLLKDKKYRNVIKDDGSISFPSSNVFTELSNAMDPELRLKPKYIYTILLSDRYSCHTDILALYNISYERKTKIDTTLDDTENNVDRFTLDLSAVWDKMELEVVNYQWKNRGSREVGTMKRWSWSHYLFEEIFKHTKIQCPLTFKRSKVSESGYAITVVGSCCECDCEFQGSVINVPVEGDCVLMECTLTNYNPSFDHKKKRQLKGVKRIEVSKELVEGKTLASVWRRKEADKLMDLGDKEPPHLFRYDVLRKAKQERQDMLLGIKSDNVMENLQLMKYDPLLEGAIRSIGIDPLFVHYWTNEQIAVYERYHDILYIDATGSLMKKIKYINGELCSHIYLYQAVTKINSKTGPVFQMVSAIQNTNAIAYWLIEFLRIGSTHKAKFPVPKEVVTDFDHALLGAVAKVFAKECTLADYLNKCYQLIRHRTCHIPPCMLRLDVCHFMNIVAKWKCWTNDVHKRIRQMYLRSIAVLRQQSTIEGIEKTAKAIFSLALNTNLGPESSSSKARNFLTASIRGILDENECYDECCDEDNNDDALDENEDIRDTDVFKWTTKIYEECENEIATDEETDDLNAFYCPAVAKKLKKLLPYFPLFTDVMPGIFGYGHIRPTSAAVESEFNDLKNRILKDVMKPMRTDKFIMRHVKSFPGKLKIAVATSKQTDHHDETHGDETVPIKMEEKSGDKNEKNDELFDSDKENFASDDAYITTNIKRTKSNESKRKRSSSDEFEELRELRAEQNWRNKNSKVKSYRYVDPFPQFDPTLTSNVMLPVIINGNHCTNARKGGNIYVVSNTCAYDSICQIMATAIKNNERYEMNTLSMNIPIIDWAKMLIKDGCNAKFYKQRLTVLLESSWPKVTVNEKIFKINAATNIANLAMEMFSHSFSCETRTQCSSCQNERSFDSATLSINFNTFKARGMTQLWDAVIDGFHVSKCCGKTPSIQRSYGPHIIIDTDTGDRQKKKLCDVPAQLKICNGEKYTIAGVISYQGTFKKNSIGHYTVYIRSAERWIHIDGDSTKGKQKLVGEEEKAHIHLCIYTLN